MHQSAPQLGVWASHSGWHCRRYFLREQICAEKEPRASSHGDKGAPGGSRQHAAYTVRSGLCTPPLTGVCVDAAQFCAPLPPRLQPAFLDIWVPSKP